jgi:hypothetical protein
LTGAALTGAVFVFAGGVFALALAATGMAFVLVLCFLTALFLLFPRCGISILSGC